MKYGCAMLLTKTKCLLIVCILAFPMREYQLNAQIDDLNMHILLEENTFIVMSSICRVVMSDIPCPSTYHRGTALNQQMPILCVMLYTF